MPKKAATKNAPSKKNKEKKLIVKVKASAKKVPNKSKKAVNKKISPKISASRKKVVAKPKTTKKTKAKVKTVKTVKTVKRSTPKKVVKRKKRTTPISSYKGRKGEKYMSAAMKKHFNSVLLEWRKHLQEEMQKTFDHLKNKGESYADPIDRASQEEEFAFELRTRDRERKLINKIAASLEQLKQDDYGYCYACGIEIGVKRLEARPTATHCIDCKTLDEIKEKQFGG
ncbi:MAG: RNA polymerase-binding protein DksA [Gammaproteobacteria bacterium]|nr:RNA polymerase-binding protein DksA [Gammaproteobacteria bacterium]